MTVEQDPEALSGLRIIDATDTWAMGEFARCLAVVWRGQPTPEAFRFRNDRLKELATREPGRCALVEIVEADSKPPDNETRRIAMDVFKQLGRDLRGVGFVLEGPAIRVTLTRAILAGMAFFVKQMQPAKVFKYPTDMASWVRPLVGAVEPDFDGQLMSALEQLRRAIKAPSA